MPFTNGQHIAPVHLDITAWTDANGSIKSGSFENNPATNTEIKEGAHSIVLPAAGFGQGYSNRFGGTKYRSENIVPVPAGALLNIVWRGYADSDSPPMLVVWIEFYGPSGQVWQQIQYTGPAFTRQWVTQSVPVSIPEDGSVTGLKISFQTGFTSPGYAAGNYYIDRLRVHNHGRDKQSGNYWYDAPPPARRAFDSGASEITISTDGAWKLKGQPFVMAAAYPDWDNDPAASLLNSYNNGFNTAYQLNPCTGAQSLLAPGQYMSAGATSFLQAGNCGYNNPALATEKFEQLIDDIGDRWISVYIDTEEIVWDSYELMRPLVAAIRQAEINKGTHRRPIFVHCQQFGGAERFHDIVDFFEFKANPEVADFGTEGGASAYDRIQGASGRGLVGHPEITNPHSTFSFNTPHNGTRISGDLIYGVLLGGAGFSLWSDRPNRTYAGVGRGYEQQPWWRSSEDIREVLAQFNLLWPMMDSPQQNELLADFSTDAQDGWEGITKSLRVVGDEIWAGFANRSESESRTITVTTSEEINAGSLVDRFDIDSSAQITGINTLEVTLAPGTGYVGSFTVGDIVEPEYELEIVSPAGGTNQNPVVLPVGTNHQNYEFSINTLTGVATQVAKFEQVNADGSLTELNRQTLTPGSTSWNATPSIDYIEGMLITVTLEAFNSSGLPLAEAAPQYYLFSDNPAQTEQRCITLDETMTPGSSRSWALSDLRDDVDGTAQRFVVVNQLTGATASVSADGLTLTVALDASATGTTCGLINIEYAL